MAASDVALVTGAGRGIGLDVARRLLQDGWRVALLDRDRGAANAAAESMVGHQERVLALTADVRVPDELHVAVDQLARAWESPAILVNNAGITVRRPLWEIEVSEWDAVLETNLRSVLIMSQLCAPAMRESGWGRVVNMASLAGQQGGLVAGAHYAAAKAGILVLTKIFAADLAGSGVTVNAIAPAAIRTPVMDEMSGAQTAELARRIPVGRLGETDDVAAAVAYLCSDHASFVTGTTLDVNGGLFMR